MVLVLYPYSSYICIRVWFTMVLVSYQCCPVSVLEFDLPWSWFHTRIRPISLLELDLSLAPYPCLSNLSIRAGLTRVLVSHPYFCPVSVLELDLSLASCLCLSYLCIRVRFTMVLVSYPCSSMSQSVPALGLIWFTGVGARIRSVYWYIIRLSFLKQQTIIPVNMPDPIRIWSGSAGKHWPELSGSDDSGTPACFRTGSVWRKADTISQN